MIGQNLLCDDSHIWHALVVFCMEKSTYVFYAVFFLTFSLVLRLRPPDKSAIVELFFFYFSPKTYVVGTQKNGLNETVLLSTQNPGKKILTILR